MTARRRVAVLISGRGSNMASLLAACEAADYPARIVAVLSNRPDAGGLERAREAGVPAEAVDHRAFPSRAAFEAELDGRLAAYGAELVALAGFMRLLSPEFTRAWAGRLVNIHPALLPAFPGLHTHERALAAGVRVHGCTVHHVTAGTDEGPIIAQAAVPVLPGDTAERLGARVLAAEHRLYPAALAMLARGLADAASGTVPVGPGQSLLIDETAR